ncbi:MULTISPECIES: recombinase family protein [unclassified Burkholderia]|uniref:recombinase family protein n=1 Tax=unclassified Burkholderia TaxID=2613784 RepID=UPI000F57BBC4|nr:MULTISPECIES: recombinase family protein [unclassified Burkholderia]RQR46164.1 recombinase family protein [Burkholderia sp. Bp9131]RQR78708.1 recombinase family protein [Burkholderia sp. Bp9015]RQS29954.1 recombinase family protein [Burkholderia sp. Bp8995]RQS48117.1 recombinase family protein [Burkholderia sp. Bp8989]RQS63338.1 recombinase family protein [Burkholderia sp. Bp8984]
MARTYFYLNKPVDGQDPEKELFELDKAGYTVVLSRTTIEHVHPYVAAAGRPELKGLLRRVAPGDSLVVLELSALGCSARDVLSTLMACRDKGISVLCVELGNVDLAGRPERQAVKTLRAIVQMEIATRSQRSQNGLKFAQERGQHTGRPASLSRHDQERVMRSLDKGLSVSEVARKFGTSRQTVMRIRASSATAATED